MPPKREEPAPLGNGNRPSSQQSTYTSTHQSTDTQIVVARLPELVAR